MGATPAIDRLAEAIVREESHEAGTARLLAANTVKKWCAAGTTHNGHRLRRAARERACEEAAEYERQEAGGELGEALALGRARASAKGKTARNSTRRELSERSRNRRGLAEGMLAAVPATGQATSLLASAATELLEGRKVETHDWDAGELREALRAELELCDFLVEALGYDRTSRPTAKRPATKTVKEVTPANVTASNGAGSVELAERIDAPGGAVVPPAPPVRPGTGSNAPPRKPATDTNRSSGARPRQRGGQGAVRDREFEREHPRAKKGRVGGGQWIQKGAGMGEGGPSDIVRALQRRLNELGLRVAPDGKFGPVTEAAVRTFQREMGLDVTGRLDPDTVETIRNPPRDLRGGIRTRDDARRDLRPPGGGAGSAAGSSSSGSGSGSAGSDSAAGRDDEHESDALRRGEGMKGGPSEDVRDFQGMLEELGYDLGAGGVDGRFGPATEQALKKLQRDNGLPTNGVFTRKTENLLERLIRKLNRRDRKGPLSADMPVQEASWVGSNIPPGSWGTRMPYGGAPSATGTELAPIVEKPEVMPPNLREATGNESCATCVHFKPDVLEAEKGAVCIKYHYSVDAHDLCDAYMTVIDPHVARLQERLDEVVAVREKAGEEHDHSSFIAARAREQTLRGLLAEVKSSAYPSLERVPGKQNWVDKAGGLPKYIERIAKHLHYEKGKAIGHAIAIAVNAVKKMCASGDVNFPGKQNVNPGSRAQACKAVAEWEAKKAKGKMKEALALVESADVDDLSFARAFAIAAEAEEWQGDVED